MNYNLLFQTGMGSFNLMKLEERKLPIILKYYEYGHEKFTISGQTYHGKNLQNFKIFTYEKEISLSDFENYCFEKRLIEKNLIGFYYPTEALSLIGNDVTEDFIGDNPYAYKKSEEVVKSSHEIFVNKTRIEELKNIPMAKFDFSRLIRLCEEINYCYESGNFLSVGMIGRTILHHVAPIFNLSSFDEVANNYGGPKENKSFKKHMTHLNESLKNIADGFLHT